MKATLGMMQMGAEGEIETTFSLVNFIICGTDDAVENAWYREKKIKTDLQKNNVKGPIPQMMQERDRSAEPDRAMTNIEPDAVC